MHDDPNLSIKATFANLCPDAKLDYLETMCSAFLSGTPVAAADPDNECNWEKIY